MHVDFTGIKAATGRYCISSGSGYFLCALLICSFSVCIGYSLSCAVSGICHNPLLLSFGPYMIIFTFHFMVTYSSLKSSVYTASHILKIDTSEICVILGTMWPSHASSGKDGKSSRHGLLDCTVCTFGNPTWMGGLMLVYGKFGASTCK